MVFHAGRPSGLPIHPGGARAPDLRGEILTKHARPPVTADLDAVRTRPEDDGATPGTTGLVPGAGLGGPSTGGMTTIAVRSRLVLHRSRKRRGTSGGGDGGPPTGDLFGDDELSAIEKRYQGGITAVEVVDLFVRRGVRFSEATFRKYVQQGLVPRSRRIGRKGKHRGSLGVYPPRTVRRVNAIKRLMAEGHTIEEIQEQFLRFTNTFEAIEENLDELFSQVAAEVAGPRFDTKAKKSLKRELAEARKSADELLLRLDGLTHRITGPSEDRYRTTGAAGSAEDLL